MKFLIYKATRIELDYTIIHNLTTDQIVELRNELSAIRNLRKLDLPAVWREFKDKDFQAVWMNAGIENDLIESLNSMIIKRKTEGNKW